jgi:hypothetical protein
MIMRRGARASVLLAPRSWLLGHAALRGRTPAAFTTVQGGLAGGADTGIGGKGGGAVGAPGPRSPAVAPASAAAAALTTGTHLRMENEKDVHMEAFAVSGALSPPSTIVGALMALAARHASGARVDARAEAWPGVVGAHPAPRLVDRDPFVSPVPNDSLFVNAPSGLFREAAFAGWDGGSHTPPPPAHPKLLPLLGAARQQLSDAALAAQWTAEHLARTAWSVAKLNAAPHAGSVLALLAQEVVKPQRLAELQPAHMFMLASGFSASAAAASSVKGGGGGGGGAGGVGVAAARVLRAVAAAAVAPRPAAAAAGAGGAGADAAAATRPAVAYFSNQGLAQVALAFANSAVPAPQLFAAIAAEVRPSGRRLRTFSTPELGALALAFARARAPAAPEVLAAVANELWPRLPRVSPWVLR